MPTTGSTAPTRWVPPPFKRRAESTRLRYKREGRCDECGAGLRKQGGKLLLGCHHPNCPRLKQIVATEKRGICSQCGAKKEREKGWDEHMQMVVKTEHCPNGHSHSMWWSFPTKRDIRELGLVETGKPVGAVDPVDRGSDV